MWLSCGSLVALLWRDARSRNLVPTRGERCPAMFWRFGDASRTIWSDAQRCFGVSGALRKQFWSDAQRCFGVSGALREQFGAMPNDVLAFRGASKAIWNDAQQGFGAPGTLRKRSGAMPNDVLAYRGASKAFWSDAQRGFGVSGALRKHMNASLVNVHKSSWGSHKSRILNGNPAFPEKRGCRRRKRGCR